MGVNVDRIAAYRRLLRKTQADLAKELDITMQAYHLKEKGKRDYTSKEIGIIASVFGVDPGDLYKDSGTPLC